MSWKVFDKLYQKYDEWFDSFPGENIFELEAECLRKVFQEIPEPWLEVGVGTGRFAKKIGIEFGIDPSEEMLKKAIKRKIKVAKAKAENLPFSSDSFGGTAMIVTFCFLDNPLNALKECYRVLRSKGKLVLGIVPRDSSWGRFYLEKKRKGHPFYSVARFYTVQEAINLSEKAGFKLENVFSTLFEKPSEENIKLKFYPPVTEPVKNAGFVCIKLEKP